ncbi:MAG: hypothetical protein WCF08_05335 [Anaerolineaceae bacterium]
MSDIFKRLDAQLKLKAEAYPEGITILDLAELPPNLKHIMKIMLREHELNFEEIFQANKELSEEDRLTKEQLQEVLDELTKQFWLICRGEGERRRYQVNLRYKKGIKAVWSILDERIADTNTNK